MLTDLQIVRNLSITNYPKNRGYSYSLLGDQSEQTYYISLNRKEYSNFVYINQSFSLIKTVLRHLDALSTFSIRN